ncbi:hypothetical protein MTP99_006259 [Tenebrio molitor]|nr:hypothetical protein MTP99_006259 [Tenebrio molitor]
MRSVAILALVLCVQSTKLPPNFQKCNRNQPDLKECVLKAAQHAVNQLGKPYRSLNVPSLDPLTISEISIGAGQGKVSLEQNFKDCSLYGFNNMEVEQFEFDLEGRVLQVKGTFPKIIIKCQYQASGQILILPIKGQGKAELVLDNLKIVDLLKYEEERKGDKAYMKFVESDLDIDPSLITFKFERFFSEDQSLADNVNKVMNDNWKEVFEDVKADYTEAVNRILLSLLNGFFSKVSIEEAFD